MRNTGPGCPGLGGEKITINSRKFDGAIRRSWSCSFVAQEGSLLTFVGEFDSDVQHDHLGFIRRGTLSYEYYWLDRWYNVFRFYGPEGVLRNYYCNINVPPKFEQNILDYVDLDLDVLVWPDRRIDILDREELERNAEKYGYSAEIRKKIEDGLTEILLLIKDGVFPFDFNA